MGHLRTVVINLNRSAERRRLMASRLGQLGIPFEFWDATDGNTLSQGEMSAVYSETESFANIGRGLHRNEIGCTLSHVDIWKALVASSDDEILVLEDDIEIADDLVPLLKRRNEWIPPGARVVYFAHHVAKEKNLIAIDVPAKSKRFLCEFEGPVMSCSAYLLRREGAINLLRHWKPIRMATDDLLGRAQFTGGGIYGVVPKPVIWRDEPSTIWTDTTMAAFATSSRKGLTGVLRRVRNRLFRRDEVQ